MSILSSYEPGDWFDAAEPTDAELVAIEAEWPSIEAELILLDVEANQYATGYAVTVHRVTRRRTRRVLDKAVVS